MNQQVKNSVQDLMQNSEDRVIRVSPDYCIVTLGNLQIENLDWRWVCDDAQLMSILMHNPFDCRFKYLPKGNFHVTKYGLSGNVSIDNYKPLWKLGTADKAQAAIMWNEMEKMKKNGSKKCENGMEIDCKSMLWGTVDTLATKARNSFRTQLSEKIYRMNEKNQDIDGAKLWNAGVPVTPEILAFVKILSNKVSK